MLEQEKSVREIQDECAQIATSIDALTHRLHRLKEALPLPPDASEIWENPDGSPWPVAVELASAFTIIIEEDMDDASQRLKAAARITDDRLRDQFRASRRTAKEER